MQKRLLAFFGIAGAVVGILVLLYWLALPPQKLKYDETRQPPLEEITLPPDELKAVRQKGTVKGKVINGVSKLPVPNATVIALRPHLQTDRDDDVPLWGQLKEIHGGRIKTAADGTFAIKDLPDDYWNLWVEKRGYGFTTVPRAKFNVEHVIEIFPGCSVHGRVVYEDGSPAAGIKIEYTPQGTHSEVFGRWKLQQYYTTTSKNGTFEYTELPPGKFTIEVYPEEHLPAPWRYQPPLDPGENRDLGERKLDRGFGMQVYVKWRGTNQPVAGVEVVVTPLGDPMPRTKTGRRRRTNSEGLARFSGLGGQVIEKPYFQIVANVDGVGPVMPDEQRMFRADETVTIYLRENSTITGTVLRPTGKILEHFFVRMEPIGFLTTQKQAWGENGKFKLYSVPEGNYLLHIRFGNLIDQAIEVTAVAGKEIDVGTITMQAGAEIIGTVRNSNGSELKGLVRVNLARKVYDERLKRDEWETVGRAYCRQDGTFFIKGIPVGTFWIHPENMTSHENTTDPIRIRITPGTGVIHRDLVIYAVARLKFRFLDEVRGVVREVVRPPTFLLEKSTGKEIRWQGEGTRLRPGAFEVYFELKNSAGVPQRYKWKELSVQAGKTTDPIEVRLYEIRDGGKKQEDEHDD